jgi:hypothetical protein
MTTKVVDFPPWPTGWGEVKISPNPRAPFNLAPPPSEGGLSFVGIFHGNVSFELDDLFFAANVLWQITGFACDLSSTQIEADSVASIKDLVQVWTLNR